MTSNSSEKGDSPLKPIPFNELFRMLKMFKLRKDQAMEQNYSESYVDNTSGSILCTEDEVLIRDETNFAATNEYMDSSIYIYKRHDLSPIKEDVFSFANESGYSSINRTNYTTSSYSNMANTAEVSTGLHEMPSKKTEFLTLANRQHPSVYSASKRSNSSKFPSFVATNSTPNKVLFNNIEPKNPTAKEKVLYQYTPSSKLATLHQELVRKPVFIPPVYNANSSGTNLIHTANLVHGSYEIIKVKECTYNKVGLIGRGGSCEVYHVFDPAQKACRAIKIVNLKQSDMATLYRNEVELLQSLQQSGRVVKLYDYEVDDSAGLLYMVLEKGEKDIDQILKELSVNDFNLPFYKILYYWMEMLYCVRDIHNVGIVHSDLKPANFLMAESGIKLIDFGIASHLQTDMTSVVRNSVVGSLNYISPEALKCDNVTSKYKIKFKSDIWSLGCILYQLVYKKAPFQHITNMWKKLDAITNSKCQIEYAAANWIPQKILGTIKKCLQLDANLRPTIDELIAEYENYNFT